MNLVLVGIGGAMGSLARFTLGRYVAQRSKSELPVGTFLINITGAILLGLVNGLHAGPNITALVADGFLGAYTTFSTFMYEGFNLFQENEKLNAFVYIAGSIIVGVIGYGLGFEAARLIGMI